MDDGARFSHANTATKSGKANETVQVKLSGFRRTREHISESVALSNFFFVLN
jgi:hypothetical protein